MYKSTTIQQKKTKTKTQNNEEYDTDGLYLL